MLINSKKIITKEIENALRDTALKATLDFLDKSEELERYNAMNEFIDNIKEEVTTVVFEIIENENARAAKKAGVAYTGDEDNEDV